MDKAQAVKDVIELFSDESKWISGALARDLNGYTCEPEVGVCWCAVGAFIKFVGEGATSEICHDFTKKYECSMVTVNDQVGGREKIISHLKELYS